MWVAMVPPILGAFLDSSASRPALTLGTPPTPSSATGLEPEVPGAAPGQLARGGAWNLAFKLSNQSQTLALLVAGSIMQGLVGIGILVTAMAATLLGQALADFGLSAEVGRVAVAHPNRHTVGRCYRAVALHAPIALVLAPAIYAALGPGGASASLLAVIGIDSALLVATGALTALMNGLHDFRTPAVGLGSARALSAVAAVVAAAVDPNPTTVIGAFALGEAVGLAAIAWSAHRARADLAEDDHPGATLKRARAWLGGAVIVHMLTSQGSTILVASILSPYALGLYATASTLQNGVITLSGAPAAPFAFRSISATLGGDENGGASLLRRAVITAAGTATVIAAVTWIVTFFAGDLIDKLSGLAEGNGPLVLALCLIAAPLSVVGTVWLFMGIGFGRHRAVGTYQIGLGSFAAAVIVIGALVAGVVGAAAATVVRDLVRMAVLRRLAVPPREHETVPPAAAPSVA
jgi:O-antigen/teichoic acid export membrane protein